MGDTIIRYIVSRAMSVNKEATGGGTQRDEAPSRI